MNADLAASERTFQDLSHPDDHDYEPGSPHLVHAGLRSMIIDSIRTVVAERREVTERPRVLELGAGHGAFTDHTLATGALVTATEMSEASASVLRRRYAGNPSARVVFDRTGECAELAGERFDIVMCMSVLHHIPDYLAAIAAWTRLLVPGGTFVSFQDPLWYARRSRVSLAADRGAFYAWRAAQGDLREGGRSLVRRLRHAHDEANPRDMVEYHVLRGGCDEDAVEDQLRRDFAAVTMYRYWSTPSRLLQRLGERAGAESTFGVVARHCGRPGPARG